MNFKNFAELRDFIRRYNSTSVLEVGTRKCWQIWETEYSNAENWVYGNTQRNYAVRLMLLASGGNPHRSKKINTQEFNNLISAYHNWNGHTISDRRILDEEAEAVFNFIQIWESDKDNQKTVRNWSLRLSEILDLALIRKYVADLFLQRLVAFQNAGFGHAFSRIKRTLQLIELLDKNSCEQISDEFLNSTKLSPINYFRQFIGCLAIFGFFCQLKGFCNFYQLPDIDINLSELGINPENLEIFVKQNSAPFRLPTDRSFRSKVNQSLNNVSGFYQPFFSNQFLETPFIDLGNREFCLPDPFSFTESCWNQVRDLFFKEKNNKERGKGFSDLFEGYLENVLFPWICPNCFQKIPQVKNPVNSKDKRADFLITLPSSYIVLECKNSIMSPDTSGYFHPNKLAELWCRIHSAFEQIAATVKALNLYDKPVIPVIMTFYDSIASSSVFEEMIRETDYCSHLGLNMPPIVHSLHQFEHWLSDRSFNNWAELVLQKHNISSPVKPDNKGHNYEHLNDVSIF
jgi:hypothetical protein